jgi:hypothetical protein
MNSQVTFLYWSRLPDVPIQDLLCTFGVCCPCILGCLRSSAISLYYFVEWMSCHWIYLEMSEHSGCYARSTQAINYYQNIAYF